MDIKDVNDFNLRTKELGCDYWMSRMCGAGAE